MNYIADVMARIDHHRALTMRPPLRPAIVTAYAQLVLTTGEETTAQHVYDAWATVTVVARPDHPDLVPFAELTEENQARDQPHADMIRAVAGQLAQVTR